MREEPLMTHDQMVTKWMENPDFWKAVSELNAQYADLDETLSKKKKANSQVISLKYANGLRNGANSDTHRCKQLTEHGEERCIKLREVAGFSAVRTIFQIVGPRKILHCLLGKWICKLTFIFHGSN